MHIQHDWHSSSFFQKDEHFSILLLSDVDTFHQGFGSLYFFHDLFVGPLFDHWTRTSNLSCYPRFAQGLQTCTMKKSSPSALEMASRSTWPVLHWWQSWQMDVFLFSKTLNVCYFDVPLGFGSCRIQGFVHIPPGGLIRICLAQVNRLRKRLGTLVFFPWIQPEQAGDNKLNWEANKRGWLIFVELNIPPELWTD